VTARALPLLRLAGSPREMGESHGSGAAALVAHNLDVYFRRFADEAELPREEVLRRAGVYWRAMQGESPEYCAMVEGIASGAGVPLLEVVALNVRFEMLYGEYSRIGQADLGGAPAPAGECTAFALAPEASPDGHLHLGQNWDWIPDVAGLLLHVTRPDGLRILCFTEAGIAGGKIGANSAGLGLVVNGLLSNEDDWTRLGRPFHVRTWGVLCSRTLAGAVTAVAGGERSCSANFLVGRAGAPGEGAALTLEAAPRGLCSFEPTGGILVHANHFRDPQRLGIWQPIVEERRSTYHRCGRMERLLEQAAGQGGATHEALRAILRDHDGHPDSVCRHPNPALPEPERLQTVVSVLIDLHAGRMDVAAGPPCTYDYQEHRI
jgi:isopenicillin-N N-acyltransferase-like protein